MSTTRFQKFFYVVILLLYPSFASAEALSIAGFHVDSGSSKVQTIANRLNSIEAIDIWVLTGIEKNWFVDVYEAAAQAAPPKNELGRSVLKTETSPTAAIFYDRKRFIRQKTVSDHAFFMERCKRQFTRPSSVPLAVAFTDLPTDTLFWMVAVPFGPDHRSNSSCFHQALADWVQSFDAPAVVFGTFDMNWTVSNNGSHRHASFDYMTSEGKLSWIVPDIVQSTRCGSDDSDGSEIGSFFFSSGFQQQWSTFSEILFKDQSYCRTHRTAGDSPHRALLAVIDVHNVAPTLDEHASIEGH